MLDANTPGLGDAEETPIKVAIADLLTMQPTPPKFWVEDLVPADVVTLLAAHGGTGKTALSAHAAVSIAMGIDFIGKKTIQANVLFYSAEDDGDQLRRLFRQVCIQLKVDPLELDKRLTLVDASMAQHILFVEGFLAGGVRMGMTTDAYDYLNNQIKSTRSQVVIVDNASDVYAADENNRSQVKGFIRCLVRLVRKLNGSVLLLSHVDKLAAKGDKREAYSGSTAWHNSVRSRLFLSKGEGDSLLLEHQKSNRGKLSEPLSLKWQEGVPVLSTSGASGIGNADHIDLEGMHKVLVLMKDFYDRKDYISTSQSAHTNAYRMLSSERGYPKALTRNALASMLREAERRGHICKENYRSDSRNLCSTWRVDSFPVSSPSENASSIEETLPVSSHAGGVGESTHAQVELTIQPTKFDIPEPSYEYALMSTLNSIAASLPLES